MNWADLGQRGQRIFNVDEQGFDALAVDIFHHQLANNKVYASYVQALGRAPGQVASAAGIPFLPIAFFKSHAVRSFSAAPALVFSSSQTGGGPASLHAVLYPEWYTQVFLQAFQRHYGQPEQYLFCCLLPSYMERQGSSLIYMAQELVRRSSHPQSGFFLQAGEALLHTLQQAAADRVPVMLLGVSFALLDFAETQTGPLPGQVTVMETGGMKGRKKELLRAELHERLMQGLGVSAIHSEYGMTELMSQAYSSQQGLYTAPPWMRVFVRSEEDPFALNTVGRGLLCIADLANVDSCAFIETADLGEVFADGRFTVLGRLDHSDIRGCSLMVAEV